MLFKKLGFTSKENFRAFITVITAGQIIYCAFEAFKASFYTPLITMLNITNTQFGFLFTLIGSAMFFYIPAGWLNNRFTPRQLIISGLIIRIIGTVYMVAVVNASYISLCIVALSWGIVDAFFWPAILNGTRLFASEENQGIAFGLLESGRRAMELGMNALALFIFTALGSNPTAMRIIITIYTVLIVLWVFLAFKFIPNIKLLKSETSTEKNKEALSGLIKALLYPEVWLSGLIGMSVYTAYIAVVYSVPYMQNVFGLSTSQAVVFGLFNASGIGILGGIIGGLLGDKVFKSPVKMLSYSLLLTVVVLLGVVLTPKNPDYLYVSMILMFIYSFVIFISRSVYFAPIGEANIPKEFSGSAMAVASFLTYSPVFWAYGVNGALIDMNKDNPSQGYYYIFLIGLIFTIIGALSAIILSRLIKIRKAKAQVNE
ncbi:MFS transporter [Brachyspira pilosicoli]|uniref:Transporter, MFS superfamily protein n=3 Tax=Brachyspira pilosicoli TaxID=52584 RepID=D8IB56_BRAP9|nr:MFS transporter [Brachyspira pilosicoli]ADK30379.1 transporter, MFS superfamily protein [Brachyspira pilosicoli 95/1000]AGA65583.1 MFS superfamily transporter [Brachyspira pilosicoli P43/6/78]MBW5398764.1 MFS transporter [Brachyspira pilosicoli]WIH83799.1 MFS transporter [Brachyspira pilosicoli]WIH86670.1 MFS transporter [Brachyspira pilosicoli]